MLLLVVLRITGPLDECSRHWSIGFGTPHFQSWDSVGVGKRVWQSLALYDCFFKLFIGFAAAIHLCLIFVYGKCWDRAEKAGEPTAGENDIMLNRVSSIVVEGVSHEAGHCFVRQKESFGNLVGVHRGQGLIGLVVSLGHSLTICYCVTLSENGRKFAATSWLAKNCLVSSVRPPWPLYLGVDDEELLHRRKS